MAHMPYSEHSLTPSGDVMSTRGLVHCLIQLSQAGNLKVVSAQVSYIGVVTVIEKEFMILKQPFITT